MGKRRRTLVIVITCLFEPQSKIRTAGDNLILADLAKAFGRTLLRRFPLLVALGGLFAPKELLPWILWACPLAPGSALNL